MQLRRYQIEFAKALLHQRSVDQNALTLLQQDNLVIYRNTILATHIRALKLTYPYSVILIGEKCFCSIAKRFAQDFPSRTSNLTDYGKEFSHYINQQVELKHLVYLEDIAQFEWACHLIRQKTKFQPNNSFLFHSRFPITKILDLCHGQQDEILNLDLYKEEMYYQVFCRDNQTSVKQISHHEYLRAIKDETKVNGKLIA